MYLLDTNICIYFLKGKFNLAEKIKSVGLINCFISEITVAELKFGIENSSQIEANRQRLLSFLTNIQILPIFNTLDLYAQEKARLRKTGIIVDDFDLLIGATAIVNGLIIVTNNEAHFSNLQGIQLENWTKE